MHKAYVIAPLIGLMLFGVMYGKHARLYEDSIAEKNRIAREASEEKARQQAAAQARVIAAAATAAERRKLEKAERDRAEEARRQARADAEQRKLAAAAEAAKLRTQVERWRAELKSAEELVRHGAQRRQELEQEQAFIANYVQQATANRDALFRLVARLEQIPPDGRTMAANPKTEPRRANSTAP